MILQGDEANFVAAEIVKSLRKDVHDHSGPRGLTFLATMAGVAAEPGRLRFALASTDELQGHLDDHCSAGRIKDRALLAAYETRIVQREWSRLQDPSQTRRSLEELVEDWCIERVSDVLLDRIQSRLPHPSPADRLARVEALRESVRGRLKGVDADIVASLARGEDVHVRGSQPRPTTAAVLNTSVFDLAKEPR